MPFGTIPGSVFLARLAGALGRHADVLAAFENSGLPGINPTPAAETLKIRQTIDQAVQTAFALSALCQTLSTSDAADSIAFPVAPIVEIPLSALRDRLLDAQPDAIEGLPAPDQAAEFF